MLRYVFVSNHFFVFQWAEKSPRAYSYTWLGTIVAVYHSGIPSPVVSSFLLFFSLFYTVVSQEGRNPLAWSASPYGPGMSGMSCMCRGLWEASILSSNSSSFSSSNSSIASSDSSTNTSSSSSKSSSSSSASSTSTFWSIIMSFTSDKSSISSCSGSQNASRSPPLPSGQSPHARSQKWAYGQSGQKTWSQWPSLISAKYAHVCSVALNTLMSSSAQ
mmetsp:Transcript_11494/g.23153  ORF Transcript_11494/g.23153 Transcript_11494/m.23153 type:complete len:217 (+) Transcript_11494:67-717(+)